MATAGMTAAIIPPPSCYHLVNELTERLSNSCGPHISHADLLHVGYSFFCEKLDQQRYMPRSYPPLTNPHPPSYPYSYSPYGTYSSMAPAPPLSNPPPHLHNVQPYPHVSEWQYSSHPYDSPPPNTNHHPRPHPHPTHAPLPQALPETQAASGHYYTMSHGAPHVSPSALPPSPYYSPSHEAYRQEPERLKPSTPPQVQTKHLESERKHTPKAKLSEFSLDNVLCTIRDHPAYTAAKSSRKVIDLAYCLWATKLGIAEGSLASQGLYLEASFMTDSVYILDGNRLPQAIVDMTMQFLRPPKPQMDFSVKTDYTRKDEGLSFLNPEEEREEMLHALCSSLQASQAPQTEGAATTNTLFVGNLPLPEGDIDLDHYAGLKEAVYSRLARDNIHAGDEHGMRLRRRSNRIVSDSVVSNSVKRTSIEPEERATKRIKLTMSSVPNTAKVNGRSLKIKKSSLASHVTKIAAPVKIKLRLATGLKSRGRRRGGSSIKTKPSKTRQTSTPRRKYTKMSSKPPQISRVSPESSPEVSLSPEWNPSDSADLTSDMSDDSDYQEILSDSQETTPRRTRTGKPSSLLPEYIRSIGMPEFGAESEQRVLSILDAVEESEVQERYRSLASRITFPPYLQPKPPDTAIDETDYWAHLTVELLKAPAMRRAGGKVTNYEYFCIYQSFVNTILAIKAGSEGRVKVMPSDIIRSQVKQEGILPGDDAEFPHPYISDEDILKYKGDAMQHVRRVLGAYSRNEDKILAKCAKVHRLCRIFGASPGILILSEELSGWRLFEWFSNGDDWRSFIRRITSEQYAAWREDVKRRLRI